MNWRHWGKTANSPLMRGLIPLFTLFFLTCSNSPNKIPSEESVFQAVKLTYDSLRSSIKDSLEKGFHNVNDYDTVYTFLEKKVLDSVINDYKKNTALTIAIITLDSSMSSIDSVGDVTSIIGIKHRVNTTIGIYRHFKKIFIWNDSLVNNTLLSPLIKSICAMRLDELANRHILFS